MSKKATIVSILNPAKEGASDQIKSVAQALKDKLDEESITYRFIESRTADVSPKDKPENSLPEFNKIAEDVLDKTNKAVVLASDYGAEPLALAKTFNDQAFTVMTSHTLERPEIVTALDEGTLDLLGVPAHATDMRSLRSADDFAVVSAQSGKVVEMTGVPHTTGKGALRAKYEEWQIQAAQGDAQSLPAPGEYDHVMTVVLPGDVTATDKAGATYKKLFTKEEARALGQDIASRVRALQDAGKSVVVCASNGPRTNKFLNERGDENKNRYKGLEHNDVNKSFLDGLLSEAWVDVIPGFIQPDVPSQGYLAFYDLMNKQDGDASLYDASLYIDGISTTMMTEAAHILDESVPVIAIDSTAKTSTHKAGMEALFTSGHVSILSRDDDGEYSLVKPVQATETLTRPHFDDGNLVARTIMERVFDTGRSPSPSPTHTPPMP